MRLSIVRSAVLLATAVVLLLDCPFGAMAQIQSGAITGTVTDPAGLAVVGARITVTSEATGAVRPATTDEAGTFNVTALPPGGYSFRVEATGFNALVRTGMSANERLPVGQVVLQLGSVTETANVVSRGAAVQTASAEQSAVISTGQLSTRKESRSLQFRWEVYNVANHTQFNAVNTTARFDPLGNQVNAQFGQVTSTRLPRAMQVSARFCLLSVQLARAVRLPVKAETARAFPPALTQVRQV